jgi:hypothetical protein
MFIYFSRQQIRRQDYRGPDFFLVKNVDGAIEREAWVIWEEGGRYPDLIIELLSASTAETDKIIKKDLYEQTFRTPEYYCYDPTGQELLGWRWRDGRYEEIRPNETGQLWSEVLQLWLGSWTGKFQETSGVWLRFFDEKGQVVPIRAEAEAARAERETARADQEAAARQAAEAELVQVRAELARLQGSQPDS